MNVLAGRVAVITGGAGLLGVRHAQAIAELGGIPVLFDLDGTLVDSRASIHRAAFLAPRS